MLPVLMKLMDIFAVAKMDIGKIILVYLITDKQTYRQKLDL